jgi:hypothetical protein
MSAEILAALARIEAKLDRILLAPTGEKPSKDMDVRKDPKGWDGMSYAGKPFSVCPPDYLEKLAGLYDWMADRDDEAGARGETDPKGYPRTGKWKRGDARLAREWAAYTLALVKAAKAPASSDDGDAIPF